MAFQVAIIEAHKATRNWEEFSEFAATGCEKVAIMEKIQLLDNIMLICGTTEKLSPGMVSYLNLKRKEFEDQLK